MALEGVKSEVVIRSIDRILKNKFLTQLNISYSGINFKAFSILRFMLSYGTFIWRRQSSSFYMCLLGPVPDHVLINHASTERALHKVILSIPIAQFNRL